MNLAAMCNLFEAIGAIATAGTFIFLVIDDFQNSIRERKRKKELYQYLKKMIVLLSDLNQTNFATKRGQIITVFYTILAYKDVLNTYDFITLFQKILMFEKLNANSDLTTFSKETITILNRAMAY